jgi:hypothetical protein
MGTPVMLAGGSNWSELERRLEGHLVIDRPNLKNAETQMSVLLERSKESQIQKLVEEDIPSLLDFFFDEL